MARELDGWIVLPWETFRLWDVIGPPTAAEGYVPAPILLNGEGYCCDHPLNIGGGTSQFGTTLYNAVYWGAYDDIKHKPHSKYISRYPVGVEATPWVPRSHDRFRQRQLESDLHQHSLHIYFHNGGVLGQQRRAHCRGLALRGSDRDQCDKFRGSQRTQSDIVGDRPSARQSDHQENNHGSGWFSDRNLDSHLRRLEV